MLAILARLVVPTVSLVVLSVAMVKSRPPDRHTQIEVTVSRNGEIETVWMLPGKIKVEKQTFKVWRNSLILCGARQNGKRQCKLAGDKPEGFERGSALYR